MYVHVLLKNAPLFVLYMYVIDKVIKSLNLFNNFCIEFNVSKDVLMK